MFWQKSYRLEWYLIIWHYLNFYVYSISFIDRHFLLWKLTGAKFNFESIFQQERNLSTVIYYAFTLKKSIFSFMYWFTEKRSFVSVRYTGTRSVTNFESYINWHLNNNFHYLMSELVSQRIDIINTVYCLWSREKQIIMLISTLNTKFWLCRFCFQKIRYTLLSHVLTNETTYQNSVFLYY